MKVQELLTNCGGDLFSSDCGDFWQVFARTVSIAHEINSAEIFPSNTGTSIHENAAAAQLPDGVNWALYVEDSTLPIYTPCKVG